jgi:hypothetical protein
MILSLLRHSQPEPGPVLGPAGPLALAAGPDSDLSRRHHDPGFQDGPGGRTATVTGAAWPSLTVPGIRRRGPSSDQPRQSVSAWTNGDSDGDFQVQVENHDLIARSRVPGRRTPDETVTRRPGSRVSGFNSSLTAEVEHRDFKFPSAGRPRLRSRPAGQRRPGRGQSSAAQTVRLSLCNPVTRTH